MKTGYHPNMSIAELIAFLQMLGQQYPAKQPYELFDEVNIRNNVPEQQPAHWKKVRRWIPMCHITPGEGEVVETKDAQGVVRTLRMQRNHWTSPDAKDDVSGPRASLLERTK